MPAALRGGDACSQRAQSDGHICSAGRYFLLGRDEWLPQQRTTDDVCRGSFSSRAVTDMYTRAVDRGRMQMSRGRSYAGDAGWGTWQTLTRRGPGRPAASHADCGIVKRQTAAASQHDRQKLLLQALKGSVSRKSSLSRHGGGIIELGVALCTPPRDTESCSHRIKAVWGRRRATMCTATREKAEVNRSFCCFHQPSAISKGWIVLKQLSAFALPHWTIFSPST